MTDSKGYYAILDVGEKASYHEIKHSYRRLARKYHPDRNRSAHAEDMIKRINAAFEVLSDQDKRTEYDKTGFAAIYEPEPEPDIEVDTTRTAGPAQETVFSDLFGGTYYLDSCETLAPKVFTVEKNKRVNPKAKVECETCAEYDKIYAAAATCPTKAIKIIDRYTGEQMYP